MKLKIFLAGLFSVFLSTIVFSQSVWQCSVPVRGALENAGISKAYLWIPEHCKMLRGVVVAQNNMEEISILENPVFRKELASMGFAEIWISPFFDHLFRFDKGAALVFNGLLNDLSYVSGYKELRYVPVVPIGHSAAASWPYYFACYEPGRTLCALSVSGQWPYFRSPVFAPDIWGSRNLDSVPCLETMGEYEAADSWAVEGLKERNLHPLMPLSMLACPAEGHFFASDKKIAYLAFYIRKALHYRLVTPATITTPAVLRPINPEKEGWLLACWHLNGPLKQASDTVFRYRGERSEAFWFFDREHAEKTAEYESSYSNKKASLLGYIQQGKVVEQRNTHLQVELRFLPEADGISFKLKGCFLDTVPGESPRPSQWTGFLPGSKIGHSANQVIQIEKIEGPFKKINDSVFQLSLQRGTLVRDQHYTFSFAAINMGDREYKPAVQQAEMLVPQFHTEGKDQQLFFPKLNLVKARNKAITLRAFASSGLPVSYYVEQGPAYVEGRKLYFTQIPPKLKRPVKITVVAWQYGNAVYKTAKPQSLTFYLK